MIFLIKFPNMSHISLHISAILFFRLFSSQVLLDNFSLVRSYISGVSGSNILWSY